MEPDDLVGATLDTVLLGPLLDGHLRYWTGDGTAHLAAVDDSEALRDQLARGVLARTSPEPGRFREVAMLHAEASTLFVMERLTSNEKGTATGSGMQVSLTDVAVHVGADLWRSAADLWRDAAVSAAHRGEFLVVEPGGWEPGSVPFAFAMARQLDDGTWQSYLEAEPAPTGPLWPAPTAKGTSIHAPATEEHLAVAGLLLADAVRDWAASPFETVLTFGTNPDGPLPG